MVEEIKTEDARVFGLDAIVYCNQHLRPHGTNWCTVPVVNKILLDAKQTDEIDTAFDECVRKGYKLYRGVTRVQVVRNNRCEGCGETPSEGHRCACWHQE